MTEPMVVGGSGVEGAADVQAASPALPWASGKALLVLFLVLLPFNLFLFPARSERLRALSCQSNPVLDVRFGYSPEEAYGIVDALGPEGRRLYAVTQVSLDLAYPALYSLLLSGLMALALTHGFPGRRRLAWLAFLPFAMALADLGENLSLTAMMLTYPPALTWLAQLANLFTLLKWGLGIASFGLILAGLVAWLVRALTK